MFEKFLSKNADTFRQRYEGTYGFYRDPAGKKLLVQISAVRDGQCSFVDAKGGDYVINADSEKDIGFEFFPPRPWYYNVDKKAVLVVRQAARQFQRGISHRTVGMYNMSADGGLFAINVNFPNLEAIYLRSKSPKEAFAEWNTRDSIAISSQFALSTKSDRVMLWENAIGKYTKTDNHFKFKLDEPNLWRTEITDAIKSLGCTSEVA